MADHTVISTNSKIYRETKNKYMSQWREIIFARDNHRCRVCGNDDKTRLNLAHITPAMSFVRHFSQIFGIEFAIKASFREDNLVTLCGSCHRLQHGEIDSIYSVDISKQQSDLQNIVEFGSAKDYLEHKKHLDELFKEARKDGASRKGQIIDLFEKIKRDRGWNNAGQLDVRTGVSGPEIFIKDQFLALAKGCRIPTGRHVVPSKEGKECGYLASTCSGNLIRCERCGFHFCEFHFDTHLIDPRFDRY